MQFLVRTLTLVIVAPFTVFLPMRIQPLSEDALTSLKLQSLAHMSWL
jgi:hypothetical protein